MRAQAESEWPDTDGLVIRMRPLVGVSGVLLNGNGRPPEESLVLHFSCEEAINALWHQKCYPVADKPTVGADGAFQGELPAGRITLGLRRPAHCVGSWEVIGEPSRSYRLQQEVEIPAEGMEGLQLRASRIEKPE